MDTTDMGLLERARGGEQGALDELFRRHAATLLAHARHKINPRWQALLTPEDVFQTTFIDAMRHIGAFVPRGDSLDRSFLQWLKRIAENNIVDVIRGLEAEGRRCARAGTTRFGRQIDASASLLRSLAPATTRLTPSRDMNREEAKRTLDEALARLPADHRRVVEWYDIGGRPIAAIAAELGRTAGSAYMLRARAHERLRELLAEKAPAIFSNP